MNKLKYKLFSWLVKQLCGGKTPITPSTAIWMLIDEENQKPEDEIRCDYIEAWEEAAERVPNYM